MELSWLDADNLDRRDIAGAVALKEAADAVDAPHEFPHTVSSFTAHLRHGWDGGPQFTALTRDARGRVIGILGVDLPHWDNTHLGSVEVTVDPTARRRGVGRRLFEAGVQRVRADGRRLVVAGCYDNPSAVLFLKAMGLDRAAEDVHRRQDLTAVDWERLDREYRLAENRASGYELVRMPGRTPEHMLDDVVRMTAAINDRPTDDLDVEDEVFSPERIRAFEQARLAEGRRLYRVAARERATGVLAGHTMVAVDSERPAHAWQYDTSVLPAHRGHRLGLLVKIAMMYWLAEEEPQLRTLDTDNAASNAHMIDVNEVLGYDIVARSIGWQRQL
jgi:GNAT superfamily N-acetyltransferase